MIDPDRLIRRLPWLALVAGVALLSGRTEAGPARSEATCRDWYDEALPPFVRFAWLSPPNAVTDSARIREMAEAGFNILLPAYNDSGLVADNLKRLDFAAAHGLRCLIADDRFLGLDPLTPAGAARLDSVLADYTNHPGLLGWYLGDEPLPPWNLLPALHHALHERDPFHVAYNNLHGRQRFGSDDAWLAYTEDFIQSCCSMLLSNDQYDFLVSGDRHQFTVNAQGSSERAAYYDIPWWAVIQLIEHSHYRALEEGELRWQVGHALAHGARGIGYFSYWTPDPDTVWNWGDGIIGRDHQRSRWFPIVAGLNRRLELAEPVLGHVPLWFTVYSGYVPPGGEGFVPDVFLRSVEGNAALGQFGSWNRNGPQTWPRYLLVAAADSLHSSTVRLRLGGIVGVRELSGGVSPVVADGFDFVEVTLDLAPGDFALLELVPGLTPPDGHADLAVAPNPGSTEVVFQAHEVSGAGRIVILDSSGRRVWTTTLPAGSSRRTWRGERDTGGTARAGIYFARIEDASGHRVQRFAWLGR